MKRLIAATLAAAALTCAAGAAFAKNEASVVITNKSSWAIHNLYLSSINVEEWGPDQLGEKVIDAGNGRFTLNKIPCGEYDVQLVDEDGDACVIGGVALCAASGEWVITDEDLLACQGATDQ
jgi:hypothetical protein